MLQAAHQESDADASDDLDCWQLGQKWGKVDAAHAFTQSKNPNAARAFCKQPIVTEQPLMGIMLGVHHTERRREHARLVRGYLVGFRDEARRLYKRHYIELPSLITKTAAELVDAA